MQPPPPSRRALVGFSGFVGQHLLSQTDFTDLYRSTNIASIASGGAEFELLVVCGLPAAKWLANKDPETDWRIVQELAALLSRCSAKQVVIISTIDVYAQPGGCTEDDDPDGQPAANKDMILRSTARRPMCLCRRMARSRARRASSSRA